MKNNKGLEAFEPVSTKAWKQKIQVDLKGGDYNDLLTWMSPEGIIVKPFYSSEDLQETSTEAKASKTLSWRIGHALVLGAEDWEKSAKEALDNGVEELLVALRSDVEHNLDALYNLAGSKWIDIHELNPNTPETVGRCTNPYVKWITDPIGRLVATGNWSRGMEADLELLAQLGKQAGGNVLLGIHGNTYQNAGATRVQELTYSLAQAHEYLLRAQEDNRLKSLLERPVFIVAIGNEYFFEIAKIRALRKLWHLLATPYGYSGQCEIIAQPSLRNKTLYDFNTNMLRTTMESMAAVLGGADLIVNQPYDHLYQHANEFGDRIGRNQLLLLKHESYFDKVSNPADGSYYIESLTDQLGSKVLTQFKNLEKGGGLLRQLKDHKIQKKIRESADAAQKSFDQGSLVLVGSNKYPNADDRMKDTMQRNPFPKGKKEKTLIEPILPGRLSSGYEQNRLRNE